MATQEKTALEAIMQNITNLDDFETGAMQSFLDFLLSKEKKGQFSASRISCIGLIEYHQTHYSNRNKHKGS